MGLQEKIDLLERKLQALESQVGDPDFTKMAIGRSEQRNKFPDTKDMLFGMHIGLVIETIDIWKQNRVRFFSPILHHPEAKVKELPWANPISAMGGFDDSGLSWVPPAGSFVAIVFENGHRAAAYYIGTIWYRNRGPEGQHTWGCEQLMEEYYKVSEGHRKGYLVGPNDESQVLPPWNTESYNGFDLTSVQDFADKPEAQKLITYPNIYGFKTPEKHMLKMVDGDPKCNRKWKRLELMSSTGNWLMMKDDHLHYCGQWSHPECGVKDADVSCVEGVPEQPYPDFARQLGIDRGIIATDAQFNRGNEDLSQQSIALSEQSAKADNIAPIITAAKEIPVCGDKIIGGHPSTGHPKSKYYNKQVGANAYFKNQNECRPYKGTGTPQNNKCDLPQSGIQLMSVAGHTIVMDDSVEDPTGKPEWERGMKPFDFGCTDHFDGRMYMKSATGHMIEMSDLEKEGTPNVRSEYNAIKLLSAHGNRIELNDHDETKCVAGEKRGITMESTSTHRFEMIDHTNEQCGPDRREGGVPTPFAKKAYVKIRSGYGLEFLMRDDNSQLETQNQSIQIYCPHYDNSRGPHIHRYQESASGAGLVLLRVAGNYIILTTDNKIEVIGDIGESSPKSNKIEIISKFKLVYTKSYYVNITEKSHLFVAEDNILLLAGKDATDAEGKPAPNIGLILMYDTSSGAIKASTRVIGTCRKTDPCVSIFQLLPFAKKKCKQE
jgi:hypothetical protein